MKWLLLDACTQAYVYGLSADKGAVFFGGQIVDQTGDNGGYVVKLAARDRLRLVSGVNVHFQHFPNAPFCATIGHNLSRRLASLSTTTSPDLAAVVGSEKAKPVRRVVAHWNLVLYPRVMANALLTVQVYLSDLLRSQPLDWGLLGTAALMTTTPILVLHLI